MSEIAGLKKNVGFLNWALGTMFVLGLGAIGGTYVSLSGQVSEVDKSVAGQSAAIAGVARTVERIEDRINGSQSQGSAGTGQAGAIREGTPERPAR